jgi:hypothetical protein
VNARPDVMPRLGPTGRIAIALGRVKPIVVSLGPNAKRVADAAHGRRQHGSGPLISTLWRGEERENRR